jgi:hypothetical protein
MKSNINLSAPKHIKGSWTEQDDLYSKELYWLLYEKAEDPHEMKLLHHALMEEWLGRPITSELEANEWYLRGQKWYQIQVNADIQLSRLKRSETKLKALERENKSLDLSEDDLTYLQNAQLRKQVELNVLDAIKEKTTKQPQPCKVSRIIPYNYKGKTINIRIEL